MVAKTKAKESAPPTTEADKAQLKSQDIKNVLMLINGADIKVEQAEVAVQLKIKLATFHNFLLAKEKDAEDAAAETQ